MTAGETTALLNDAEKIFAAEANLIRLQSGRAVFVGDTHGDLEASRRVIDRYLRPGHRLVFLGDYVDRGPSSLENINFLLQQKIEHPDDLFLLMGNHEGYAVMGFHPADFWQGLDDGLRRRYGEVLSSLPLAASAPNGIIALHGALPDVPDLEALDRIEPGSVEWRQLTWGDWQETEGDILGDDPSTGRPQFGRGWFESIMGRLGLDVLIRSHQPDTRDPIYDGRCITIFTSSAYGYWLSRRRVAVVDLTKQVKSVADVLFEDV